MHHSIFAQTEESSIETSPCYFADQDSVDGRRRNRNRRGNLSRHNCRFRSSKINNAIEIMERDQAESNGGRVQTIES